MRNMAGHRKIAPTDIRALATTSDGGCFVIGAKDGAIRLGTTNPLRHLYSVDAHPGGVLALAIVEKETGTFVFSSGTDCRVRRWRLADDHLIDPTDLSDIQGPAIAVTENWLASATHDGVLRVGDHDGNPIATGRSGIQVRAMALDGQLLAVAGTDDERAVAQIWRIDETGITHRKTTATDATTRSILFVDNETIVLGGDNAQLVRWNWTTDEKVPFGNGHDGPVHALARATDMTILSGGADGRVLRWHLADRCVVDEIDAPRPKLTSDEPATHDTIGNSADVRAIAELVTAHPTPLSVALLGDRGSGKSSTVLQVADHVRAGNVRQIRFNAWHYSDIELWVGLLEEIVDGLRQQAPSAAHASASEEREAVEAQHAALSRLVDEVTREIDHAHAPRTSLLRRARHLGHAKAKLAGAGDRVATRLADARLAVRRRRRALFFAAVAVAVAVPLVLYGRTRLPWAQAWLWPAGAGVAVVLIAAVTCVRKFSKHTDHLRDVLMGQVDDFRAEQDRLTTRRDELDPVHQLRQALDELSGAEAHARHRGVIGSVHQDLRKLAGALRKANQTPTPVVERIVLYVDDLDRCAPTRVMEVLEAVNLLLSMRMFVVVVAVDPRMLRDALEVTPEYAFGDDEQRHRRVLSLLDKVFTVVYAVRPLGNRRASYLMRLLDDLTPHVEADLLASLAELLPGPRAVKKLTNIYRLVLADQHHRTTPDGDHQAAAIMVAGLVRDPEEFAKLIDHLGTAQCPEHGHQDVVALLGTAGGLGTVLSGLVARHVPSPLRCAELYRDWSVRVARYSFETYRGFVPS